MRPTWAIDRWEQRHQVLREAEALQHSPTLDQGRTNASSPAASPVNNLSKKNTFSLFPPHCDLLDKR